MTSASPPKSERLAPLFLPKPGLRLPILGSSEFRFFWSDIMRQKMVGLMLLLSDFPLFGLASIEPRFDHSGDFDANGLVQVFPSFNERTNGSPGLPRRYAPRNDEGVPTAGLNF
jgi:hypothetical protein